MYKKLYHSSFNMLSDEIEFLQKRVEALKKAQLALEEAYINGLPVPSCLPFPTLDKE